MSDPQVSIVIPTFNSEQTLESCLASIRDNNSKYQYEIIVIDAGSDDATINIAEKYADHVLNGTPGAVNRNKGVSTAKGEFICFTDSDCIVPENWIDWLVDGLQRLHDTDHKVVGVGGASLLWIDNPSLTEYAVLKAISSPFVSFRARNFASYQDERQVLHNPPMNSVYFKWAIDQTGGFVEEYGYGAEDLELDAKLNQQGYKLYYLPQLTVRHVHRAGFNKFIKQMYRHGIARIRVGKKYKGYLEFHHYGPLFLLIMMFTPLIVFPLGLGIANGAIVGIQERSFRLFILVMSLTLLFYICYGFGELMQILHLRREPK